MEEFKMNLLQGKYKEAEKICKNMANSSIKDMIMTIAYDARKLLLMERNVKNLERIIFC